MSTKRYGVTFPQAIEAYAIVHEHLTRCMPVEEASDPKWEKLVNERAFLRALIDDWHITKVDEYIIDQYEKDNARLTNT